jgi:hypothetical protein
MKRLWPLGVLLLHGCAEPQFTFRGYTELSDCRAVLDAELAGGARFQDAVDTDTALGEGVVTQLVGELFTVPARIFVSCYRNGAVSSVDYISDTAVSDESAAWFEHLARELDAIFGARPRPIDTAESRTLVYNCGDPVSVVLREARHGDMDFEVSLAVMPGSATC